MQQMPAQQMTIQQLNADAFWQVSLVFYPQVQPLCLQLQDNWQANVNLLLLLSYTEQLGWQLDAASLTQGLQQMAPLNQHITQVLRQCRRELPKLPLDSNQQTELKQGLLQTELVAERLEQQLLCHYLRFKLASNPDNLSLYCQQLPATNEALQRALFDLRQAAARFAAAS
ncbi:TIGR02444 family protein [Alishewanella sp. HH-ZS]|uniref:TIGR02444 family protein n=1 Tax=Alishewanella sp. HH-ZS TaxID=1856684 RepID=UPI0008236A2A|nr:TIGR02444 family protein [Alishewanella sp. HH-ZS]OCW96654.1 TIGR02444 family protein [Alishewanella sp. HH-ZS]